MRRTAWRDSVVLRRNPRSKHVRLKIHPPGKVELVVPKDFDEQALPALLDRHTAWVEERLLHVADQLSALPLAPETITLPAIDEQWRIVYRRQLGGRNSCRERGGELIITAGEKEQHRTLLKRWLARRAKRGLIPWLEQCSVELGLPFSGVTIRGQRSRWGSCSAAGHINLNYALLFLNPELVRYLFVHELCHTVHLNHSSAYWSLVRQKEPDYRVLEKGLKQAARQVPAWLHMPFSGMPDSANNG